MTLYNMPEYELVNYYQVNRYLLDNAMINKNIIYNKEYYYLNKKLVLKVSLRTNSIAYKFKNKNLLK